MNGDRCAACGILLDQADRLPGEPPSNGICCSACLAERPELAAMGRDEITVWHWQRWGTTITSEGGNDHIDAALAWLRVQAAQGRVDEGMADVAVAAFRVSQRALPRLRRYVAALRGAPA